MSPLSEPEALRIDQTFLYVSLTQRMPRLPNHPTPLHTPPTHRHRPFSVALMILYG